MERTPWFRAVLVLLTLIGSLWLLGWIWELAGHFADVIMPFFLAWLLAFVLYPITEALARVELPGIRGRRPMGHGPAAALVYLGLILLLVILGILLVPVIVAQVAQLGASLPQYVGQLPTLAQLQDELTRRGIPVDLAAVYQQQTILDQARSLGGTLAQNALSIATGVALVAFNLLIVLILSFYFMLDGPQIARQFLELVPARYQREAAFFAESVTRTFGGFIRGQLLQAGIYGLGTALIMTLAGLQYVAAVSAFGALSMIIPFIGPLLAIVPPIGLAAAQAPQTFIWVLIALLALQMVVTNVIAPKIMSQTVGLHPLLVLLATMIGVKVAGFWGALFGVPVVGVVYASVVYLYQHAMEGESAGGGQPGRADAPREQHPDSLP
jgi:predicted PurR-regulated permease PerM